MGGAATAKVLVVDDELFFREAIGEILEREKLAFVMAESGEQALELAADSSVGVVVLDIRLPDMDGIQVLGCLSEMRPDLRVIMLSASTDQEMVLEALRLGACDYLAKPLHEEELVLAIRRGLDNHALVAESSQSRERLERLVGRFERHAAALADLSPAERSGASRQAITEITASVLGADRVSLMLLDQASRGLEVVAWHGDGFEEPLEIAQPGEGVAGRALLADEVLAVDDVDAESGLVGRVPDGRYRSRSFAVAPLRVEQVPVGVLCVTERRGDAAIESDELCLLRLLAMQASELLVDDPQVLQALEAAGIERPAFAVTASSEESVDLDPDAELARQICEAVAAEVAPERVLGGCLSAVAAALRAAPVSIYLLDNEAGDLVCEAQQDQGVVGDRARLPRDKGLVGAAVQAGQLIATDHPDADPRFAPQIDTPESGAVLPYLCMPLQLRGKVVGVARLFLEAGGLTSPRTGEVLSAALAAAVRNVLLYRSLLESIDEVAAARRAARRD